MELPIIAIAVSAYFLFALTSIMDKHIVSNTQLEPLAYAFYSGFFQILYVIAIPVAAVAAPDFILGFLNFPSIEASLLAIIDGIIFVISLVALYRATKAGEISRISPIIGVLVPIFIFFLSAIFLKEVLAARELIAFVFFILGGFLMSAKLDKKGFSYIKGTPTAILAGFLFAVYYVIMSYLFKNAGFVEVFVLMQFGGFLGALILLIPSRNRKEILNIKAVPHKSNKKTYGTFIFFANKALSAAGSLLLNYAIALGSVTMVNSLQAVQYAFILVFAIILSKKMPHFFDEETHRSIILQKGTALALTAIGLILIANIKTW